MSDPLTDRKLRFASSEVGKLQSELAQARQQKDRYWDELCEVGFALGVVTPENNLRLAQIATEACQQIEGLKRKVQGREDAAFTHADIASELYLRAESAEQQLAAAQAAGQKCYLVMIAMRACAELREAPDSDECQKMGEAMRSWEAALGGKP